MTGTTDPTPETPEGTPEPSAALQSIRDRAGIVAKLGPPRPGGDLINAAHRSAADVPCLLAALEAALRLADTLSPQAPPASALEEDRMFIRQECADMIREAITRTLNGDTDA